MSTAIEMPDAPEADRIEVYLDDGDEPIASYQPPARIQFDTEQLEDGHHELRIEATGGDEGVRGVRTVEFDVRNGPAIDVEGLRDGDVVSGDVSVMVHAWGGAGAEDWEASRAESPAPAPTWAWVMLIIVISWSLYYAVAYWNPPEEFLDSPTYPTVEQKKSE